MGNAATIRAQVEGMLEARIPSALTPKLKISQDSILCGIREIDRLEAFPRGTLVEICGAPSTGRTTIFHGLLARCTGGGEAAAIIDVTDAFDPVSASQSGVVLSELLWVRCGATPPAGRSRSPLEQALDVADLLLHSGGFGLLALDLGDVAEKEVRRISLTTWFLLRRSVAGTQTLCLVLERQSHAGSNSATVLDLSQSGFDIEENGTPSKSQHLDGNCLIRTLRSRAELLRGQRRKPVRSIRPVSEFSTSLHSYR
jgi:recA bacterial DNA recombination protein